MRVFELKQKLTEMGVKGHTRLKKAELEVLYQTELEKIYKTDTDDCYKIEGVNINETEFLEFNSKDSKLPLHTFHEWTLTKKKFAVIKLYKNGRLINMRKSNGL